MKKVITCSLCKKKGHNVRGCSIPTNMAKESLYYYKEFIKLCILNHSEEWNNDILNDFNPEYNFDTAIKLMKNNESLYNILNSNVTYLENLNNNSFKALCIYYDLKRFVVPKNDICKILNTVLLIKADTELVNSYNISPNSVEYIKKTLPTVESFTEITNDCKNIVSIHSININNDKLIFTSKETRIQKLRRLRFINNDNIIKLNYELSRLKLCIRTYTEDIEDLFEKIHYTNQTINEINNEREHFYVNDSCFTDITHILAAIKIIDTENNNINMLEKCPICYSECTENFVKIDCGHVFCNKCLITWIIKKYVETVNESRTVTFNVDNICTCALCRKTIKCIYGGKNTLLKYINKISEKHNIQNIEHLIN